MIPQGPADGTRRGSSGQNGVRESPPLKSTPSGLFATLLTLLAAVPAAAKILDAPGIPEVRVEVRRSGDEWRAEYTFDRTVAAWVFPRSRVTRESGKPWRETTWTVETRGVRLERRGDYDIFRAAGEVPKRVSVRFKPLADNLRADYPPALRFTDGSVALFVAQFEVFPLDSLREVRALPGDLNNVMRPATHIEYVFQDVSGPVLLDGRRGTRASTHGEVTYALFGSTRALETPDMVGIFDPQLPAWTRDSLTRAVPALMSRYTQELGALGKFKPTFMVTWAGPTAGIVARNGSTLPGLITLNYEGEGMLRETSRERQQGLWFIAHEAAHFWFGQTVSYEYARDTWITEGGAELLSLRAVAELDPGFDVRAELNQSIADCIRLTHRRGIEGARERGEQRAYYACGAVFALVAEAGSGRSFYKFARQLIDANRADGVVSRADWLAALDAATRKPALGRDIARLLDRGASDSGEFITRLLEAAGVDVEPDAAGIPRLR